MDTQPPTGEHGPVRRSAPAGKTPVEVADSVAAWVDNVPAGGIGLNVGPTPIAAEGSARQARFGKAHADGSQAITVRGDGMRQGHARLARPERVG